MGVLNNDYASLFEGTRVESYTMEVVDRDGVCLGELGCVTGGTFTASTDARIKTAARIEVESDSLGGFWGDLQVRITAHVNEFSWPLGVFVPSSPVSEHSALGAKVSVDLLDRLVLVDKDCVDAAYSIPAKTRLVGVVRDLLKSVGVKNHSITDSTKTNRTAMTWEAGTSKLTVINDILDYMEYFSLTADPYGVLSAQPYVIPRDRPLSWSLEEGALCMFTPDFTHTYDLDGIPNKVVYISDTAALATVDSGDGAIQVDGNWTRPAMVAVATNMNPASPYSYQARGRWVTEISTGIEAESQEVLQKKVQRRLENAQDPIETVEIRHAVIPVGLNQIVDFTAGGYAFKGNIRKYEISLSPAQLMTLKLRKVNYADNEPGSADTE